MLLYQGLDYRLCRTTKNIIDGTSLFLPFQNLPKQ
jgi:hypothetical protein